MDSETPFTALAPPVFKNEGYQIWAARIEAHMEANDLWEVVEEDYEVPPLPANPSMAQIKNQKEKKTRKSKARATLFAVVSFEIFVRIMTMKSAFEMKDSETIREYSDRLLSIANNVRLLAYEFPDSRLVQKILVTAPERFEATISLLENSKDLSKVSLAELLNSLQAQEQRRHMRSEGSVEGALPAKVQSNQGDKGKKKSGTRRRTQVLILLGSIGKQNMIFLLASIVERKVIHSSNAGEDQINSVKNVANQEDEEQLFVATFLATSSSSDKWLIDSGCTNHITFDHDLFKELDTSVISKVQIGNGEYLPAEGKGTVAIKSSSGTKLIKDVFFVPNLSHSLLSVGQLLENGFKLLFEINYCQIKDVEGNNLFKVMMKAKRFTLDPLENEQKSYSAIKINAEVWHKWLIHFNHAALLNLQRRDLVRGLLNLEAEIPDCKTCRLGKKTRLPFKKAT
ncbi:uncharacterized protein LOC132639253 [Lycium barbarum]|uniref:uncharacterized protein LOC132639253 n=1 Tax=Lycium barbarum TaxID=112863 RepID=UPI00293E25E8|nr:uncharacterized protein LOC132639253 [Lycium barbarum]